MGFFDKMKKKIVEEDEPTPSWAQESPTSGGNNGDDGDETTPLFGTGQVSLQDPEGEDEETPFSYGATAKKDEEDEDEEAPAPPEWHEESTTTSSETKKPKKSTKKAKGKKKTVTFNEPPPKPRKNCCLHVFHLIEAISILASLSLLATQVLPLFLVPFEQIGILQLALRCYVSLFCLLFVLVEYEAPLGFIQNSHVLQSYFTRGFLYSFVGLIGMEEAVAVRVGEVIHGSDAHHTGTEATNLTGDFHVAWAPLVINGASWIMVGAGCIYMVLGILCMKRVRDGLNSKYLQEMEIWRDEMEDGGYKL